MEKIIYIFLILQFFAIISAVIANYKKYNLLGWYVTGFLSGPISLVLLLLLHHFFICQSVKKNPADIKYIDESLPD